MARDLKRLPIFRVDSPRLNIDDVEPRARALLESDDYSTHSDHERIEFRAGPRTVDFYRNSGALWMADSSQLWRPELTPKLLHAEAALSAAEKFAKQHALLPRLARPFAFRPPTLGGTWAASRSVKGGDRTQRQLDVSVTWSVGVDLGTGSGGGPLVPVVGGGGKFSVSVGDGGRVIACSGGWRTVLGQAAEAAAIGREEADARFMLQTRQLDIQSFDASLAYYAAPGSADQTFLHPVWVYTSTAAFGKHSVPIRAVLVPASEFGPHPRPPEPQDRRPRERLPVRKPLPTRVEEPKALTKRAAEWREAGTSWIGETGGLTGSKNNAKGFVDGLSADGWKINFNWGDASAWESDWRAHDDEWVDATDFVFYTGHASGDGWVLSRPGDDFLHFTEVGAAPESPGDLWGNQDLEWVVIAACGPLQEELLCVGGGDVFARWQGAFDGLHTLMGYGAVTYDNEDEGKLLAKYTTGGTPIIDAWLRVAREVQPATNDAVAPNGPTIWVGALYAGRDGETTPRNDHIWGHGSVCADPRSPNTLYAIWTTT